MFGKYIMTLLKLGSREQFTWSPAEITGTLGNGLSDMLDQGRVGIAQTEGTLRENFKKLSNFGWS